MQKITLQICITQEDLDASRGEQALVEILLDRYDVKRQEGEGLSVHPGRASDLLAALERQARLLAAHRLGARSNRVELVTEFVRYQSYPGIELWDNQKPGPVDLSQVVNALYADQKLRRLAAAAVLPDRPDPDAARSQAARLIEREAASLPYATRAGVLSSLRAEQAAPGVTTESPRTAGLRPAPTSAGRLMNGERSEKIRLRGPADALDWFEQLTPGQRGTIAALAHARALELAED